MGKPLVSILVPTYNYAEGLRRIVGSLGQLAASGDIEVRVYDDSSDDRIAAEIEQITRSCFRSVYRRSSPPSGAVRNWNSLLDHAVGDYCLLMHHDEYFETQDALAEALTAIRRRPQIDAVVFSCRIITATHPRGRRHLPVWLSRWIVETMPGYILRRNPFGAPSVLLLRRSHYPRYDERLQWLVDCELYVRVIVEHRPQFLFKAGAGVVSDSTAVQSITAKLGRSTDRIRGEELRLLLRNGPPAARGAWLVSRSHSAALARALESVGWAVFRASHRLAQFVTRHR